MASDILPMLLLAETDYRGQLMLLGGISLLIWVLFRRHMRMRTASRQSDRDFNEQRRKWAKIDASGYSLNDAPKEVMRWQAGMFDLQRELKSELDARIAVVQSLVRLADERIADLQQLQEEQDKGLAIQTEQIRQLALKGLTTSEIAEQIKMSVGDVEFLRGLA